MAEEITIQPDYESMPSIAPDTTGDVGGEDDPKAQVFVKDSLGLKSGKYSKNTIRNIVAGAKATGVDPLQALALSLQESGFGTATVKARRGTTTASLAQIKDFSDQQEKEVNQLSKKTGIDPEYLKLGIVLRDKLAYAASKGFTTEPEQLQAFNGYGTITPASFGGATKAYGVDISNGINLRDNPLYGKRLVQLKNDLMANDYIQSLLK
jgi:hypothetical protein